MSHTKTFYIGDVEFEVEFSSMPYKPAKISGPPEHGHPAEGGDVVAMLRAYNALKEIDA